MATVSWPWMDFDKCFFAVCGVVFNHNSFWFSFRVFGLLKFWCLGHYICLLHFTLLITVKNGFG